MLAVVECHLGIGRAVSDLDSIEIAQQVTKALANDLRIVDDQYLDLLHVETLRSVRGARQSTSC
jgi:hypothetical protein